MTDRATAVDVSGSDQPPADDAVLPENRLLLRLRRIFAEQQQALGQLEQLAEATAS